MGQLTLVLGGVRSGKSRWAEQLAAAQPPVTYLATAEAGDAEMAERIARHRQRRPAGWQTVEEAWDVAQALADLVGPSTGQAERHGCVLLECLPLWLTNLLLGLPGHPALAETDILATVKALIPIAQGGARQVIVVSNEVGCGILPANALARRFGDLLGELNQQLAAAAGEVYGCLVGLPLRLK